MIKVKILIEGYADFSNPKKWKDNCNVILIESEDKKIIFDPGVDRKKLINSLKKEGLTAKDITHVFISHKHIDHTMLMGIFRKAIVCTGQNHYQG